MDINIDKYMSQYKELGELDANYVFSTLGCEFNYNICPFYNNNAIDDIKIGKDKYNIIKPEINDRPIVVF